MRGRKGRYAAVDVGSPPSCGLVRRSPKREALNGEEADRPHPSPNTDAGAVASIRDWLRRNGVEP